MSIETKWNRHFAKFISNSLLGFHMNEGEVSHCAANRRIIQMIANMHDVRSILEIGSDGYFAHEYINRGIDYMVATNSPEDFALCNQRGVSALCSDMHDIDLTDDAYDLVLSRHVLEHAFSLPLALAEMRRVAKKYVYVALPDSNWITLLPHVLIPTQDQLKHLGQKLGLDLIHSDEIHYEPPIVPFDEATYVFKKVDLPNWPEDYLYHGER